MNTIISFLKLKYRTQFIFILQISIGSLLEINMLSSLQRITIEAVDCVIKTNNDPHGHLNISIEPRIPVESTNRNADPSLFQPTGQQKDTLPATAVSSTNPIADLSTPTDTITIQTDTPKITLTGTMTSTFSPSEDIDTDQYLSTSDDEIEDVTPVQDNKIPGSNDTPNEPSTSQLQQNTTQTQTDEDDSDFDMSDYMKCPRFQEKLKSVKTKLTEEISDAIAKNPEQMTN